MLEKDFLHHEGVVVQGHRIASGLSPTGKDGLNATVVKQMPFFIKEGIPHAEEMFTGTVNVNLRGFTFAITSPKYTVTCEWSPGVVETFWFIPARLINQQSVYDGYVYFPLPSKVQRRNREVMELLMPKIPNLSYGTPVSVEFPAKNIRIFLLGSTQE